MLKIIQIDSESVSIAKLKKLIPGYELMLKTVLVAIIDRFERDEDYHFIDTKLNYAVTEDPCVPIGWHNGGIFFEGSVMKLKIPPSNTLILDVELIE